MLVTAHRELESLALDRETAHYQQIWRCVTRKWFITACGSLRLRESLDAFFTASQKRVTGSVGLTLFKGNVTVASRRSPYSLYRTNLASFTMTGYNPKDAEGFINLFALAHHRAAGCECQRRKPQKATADDRSRRSKNVGRPVRTRARRFVL